MKIIGIKDKDTYIAEVSHIELEKVFDKYYNKLNRLIVGESIDLEDGYDFTKRIKETCGEMVSASRAFERNFNHLLNFAHMVLERSKKDHPAAQGGE